MLNESGDFLLNINLREFKTGYANFESLAIDAIHVVRGNKQRYVGNWFRVASPEEIVKI